MKKAFAILLSLCLLLTAAPCVQGAEPAAEFDGYLVKVKAEAPASIHTFGVESSQPDGGLYVVDRPEEAVKYAAPSQIEYIEPNYILTALEGETLPYVPSQWELEAISADTAWNQDLYGEGVKIAVIDSGLRTTHEDLDSGKILPVVDFTKDGHNILDATGHGTVVAGMIAAQVGNAQTEGTPPVDGIASKATILPLRVFSKIKTATVEMAVNAIYYAIEQDCDVINMSFGIRKNSSQALLEACQDAAEAGILLVAAAGNWYGTDYSYPASYDCVVSVASVQQGAQEGEYIHAPFSQQNDGVLLAAPGVGITGLSYAGDNDYVTGKEGTSFSAPMISAMAALAKEQNPKISGKSFEKLLIASCIDLGTPGKDHQFGYGLIDMERYVHELTREYTIAFVNDESLEHWPENTAYRLDRAEGLVLPVPVRDGYTFLGWYDNTERTGEAIFEIPSGAVGDCTLYAAWESNDEAEVQSILAGGYMAERSQEKEDAFTVTIPKNCTLEASTIQIQTLAEGASVSNLTQTDAGWEFTVTSQSGNIQKNYMLLVTQSENSAPILEQETPAVGTAVPASLDGVTPASIYSVNTAQYFTDPDAQDTLYYELVDDMDGSAALDRENGLLTFTPQAKDAGKSVEIRVCASDGMFSSEPLTLLVEVGQLPASQPSIGWTEAEFDLSDPKDIEVKLELYGSSLQKIICRGGDLGQGETILTAGTDYALTSSLLDEYDAVKLFADSLKKRKPGTYQIVFEFDKGSNQELTLKVADSSLLTVQFITDGGKVYAERKDVPKNSTVTLPADPSRDGYIFGGWYTKPEGAGTKFTARTPVTSSLQVYAKWTASGGNPPGGGGTSSGGGGGGGGGMSIPTFTITASAGAGGAASPDIQTVQSGEDAAVTILPDPGYAIAEIWVDKSPIELPKDVSAAFVYTFSDVKQAHTVHANFIKQDQTIEELVSFTDVLETDWFYEEVQFVSRKGLFSGSGDGRFCPNDTMTRSMLVSVLYRLAGAPQVDTQDAVFSDVPADSWYAKAVLWAASNGIVSGYGDGSFGPEDSITREGIASILWRYAGCPGAGQAAAPFEDAAEISAYAADAVSWAIETGLLAGSGNCLKPGSPASRAEVAAILMRFCNLSESSAN